MIDSWVSELKILFALTIPTNNIWIYCQASIWHNTKKGGRFVRHALSSIFVLFFQCSCTHTSKHFTKMQHHCTFDDQNELANIPFWWDDHKMHQCDDWPFFGMMISLHLFTRIETRIFCERNEYVCVCVCAVSQINSENVEVIRCFKLCHK